MNQVISFSGGKDSTAMLLKMLENGEDIHSVVAFDTGWEFPQMLEHWDQVEEYTGIPITRLHPRYDFTESLFTRPIKKRDGTTRCGNGWPSWNRRWCTREKIEAIDRYVNDLDGDSVVCIGFASDESSRVDSKEITNKKYGTRFPLIELGLTEENSLKVCTDAGFDWGGLYEEFSRLSCFCCPLQTLDNLRSVKKLTPDLWDKMLDMDVGGSFHGYDSVLDLHKRFEEEEHLGKSFNIREYNRKVKKDES